MQQAGHARGAQKSGISGVRSFLRHWQAEFFFATNRARAVFTGLESGRQRQLAESAKRKQSAPPPGKNLKVLQLKSRQSVC